MANILYKKKYKIGGNYKTTEKGTLETGRAKGHVLCTGRALSVHVHDVSILIAVVASYLAS